MSESKPKLQRTKDYSLFVMTKANRPLAKAGRADLRKSMQEYGFLPTYPIHVRRVNGKLEIQDGQNRFMTARELGQMVWYVEDATEINIARINNTQKKWKVSDYAGSYANQGKAAYRELLDFAAKYKMPIGLSAALLGGHSSGKGRSNWREAYELGTFQVRDREAANLTGRVFAALVSISAEVNSAVMAEALSAVFRISNVDANRIVDGAKRCPEKLVGFSSREGYLQMIEDLYNYGRRTRYPIKVYAENALRARNIGIKRSEKAGLTTSISPAPDRLAANSARVGGQMILN